MPLMLVHCHLLVQSTLDNSGEYYKSLLGCCIYVSLSERWVLYYHIYHTFSNRILAWLPEINPMGQVPAIVDGRFKLFERYPSYFFFCFSTCLSSRWNSMLLALSYTLLFKFLLLRFFQSYLLKCMLFM